MHAFEWAVGSRIFDRSESMFDPWFTADTIKSVFKGPLILRAMRPWNTVTCQDGMDFIGDSGNPVSQEVTRCSTFSRLMQLRVGKFRGTIDNPPISIIDPLRSVLLRYRHKNSRWGRV